MNAPYLLHCWTVSKFLGGNFHLQTPCFPLAVVLLTTQVGRSSSRKSPATPVTTGASPTGSGPCHCRAGGSPSSCQVPWYQSQAATGRGGSSLLVSKTSLVTTGPPHLALPWMKHWRQFLFWASYKACKEPCTLPAACSVQPRVGPSPLREVTGDPDWPSEGTSAPTIDA